MGCTVGGNFFKSENGEHPNLPDSRHSPEGEADAGRSAAYFACAA